jgi:type VI secretion system protein ImpJ
MRKNKVIWSEGMFLQTQHFQQQERYLEHILDQKARHLHSFGWGYAELALDHASLARGKLGVTSASGMLPDGTSFRFPEQDPVPPPLEVPADTRGAMVYLAVPLESDSHAAIAIDAPGAPTMHRYTAQVTQLRDCIEGFTEEVPVQLGRLNLRLLQGSGQEPGFARIGLARIVERKADGQVVLDPAYIPPVLDIQAAAALRTWIKELHGLVHQRSEVLAQRMTQPGRGGMAEVADFLLLMVVNRYSHLLGHLASIPGVHPERLYSLCLALAGELAAFGNERRIVAALPPYNHDELEICFQPLIQQLRLALSLVLEQTALQIELRDRKYGVRVAVINDKQLLSSSSFVLAVSANLPGEALRARFPAQIKIGTIEKIRDLVNLQLQGIPLRPLPVAPRQIPYHAGFNYFELDKGHEMWRQLATSGGMALHIAGEFPGLELEMWAIRGGA